MLNFIVYFGQLYMLRVLIKIIIKKKTKNKIGIIIITVILGIYVYWYEKFLKYYTCVAEMTNFNSLKVDMTVDLSVPFSIIILRWIKKCIIFVQDLSRNKKNKK